METDTHRHSLNLQVQNKSHCLLIQYAELSLPAHPMKVNETTSVSRPNSTLEKIFYLDHSCLHLPYY